MSTLCVSPFEDVCSSIKAWQSFALSLSLSFFLFRFLLLEHQKLKMFLFKSLVFVPLANAVALK